MKKFLKWLASLFSSGDTVVTVGNGNSTFVSKRTTTVVKLPPLTQEEISEIARKAVNTVAEQKIVTKAIAEERKPVKTSPGPNAKPLKAEELKRVVTVSKSRSSAPQPSRSRAVSDDDGYRRRSDDAVFINTTTISDTYTHHTPSHSGGYDPSPSCDSSPSYSGSCD